MVIRRLLLTVTLPLLCQAFILPASRRRRFSNTLRSASPQYVPEDVEKALSSKRLNRDLVRLLVSEAIAAKEIQLREILREKDVAIGGISREKDVALATKEIQLREILREKDVALATKEAQLREILREKDVALATKDVELSHRDVELERKSGRLQRFTMQVLRLQGLVNMRGAYEEIVNVLREETQMFQAAWTKVQWEDLFSRHEWQPLRDAMLKATGWKAKWLPEKLEGIWHSLSARVHDVEVVQGVERDVVIISKKVLSGEECLALGTLCDHFNVSYLYDGQSGYLYRGDLITRDAEIS